MDGKGVINVFKYRYLHGMMEENMKVITKMIKNMDMVFSYGLMEEYLKHYI